LVLKGVGKEKLRRFRSGAKGQAPGELQTVCKEKEGVTGGSRLLSKEPLEKRAEGSGDKVCRFR